MSTTPVDWIQSIAILTLAVSHLIHVRSTRR